MEYFDVINKRYSCREFLDKKISRDELNKVLEAGVIAPTAVNYQPERIIVIDDSELLSRLATATKYTFGAKTILCIVHDTNESWHRYRDNRDFGTFDSAICVTHMALAATDLGLGTCIVCSMDEAKVKEILNLDERFIVDALLPIGYPKNPGKHAKRKNIDEIVDYR